LYRQYLYELAKVPGHEAEVYTKLRKLYESSPREDFPTTKHLLPRLEEFLHIPIDQRCVIVP
jgi:hypothetical protein